MAAREKSLPAYVDSLEASGRTIFLRELAIKELGISKDAFKLGAHRLIKKKRIAGTKGGFFIIIPLSYRVAGALPATWFIDDLMAFHQKPYYVGILSAAEIHGAAHQRPQVFQVVTDSPTRSISFGRTHIHFYTKRLVADIPVEKKQTETGHMNVSTPEATALDLVRYAKAAGGLDNVATVLIELAEVIRAKELAPAAAANEEISTAQRLGYLLDQYADESLTFWLEKWLRKQELFRVPLAAGGRQKTGVLNKKWNVVVNTEIEPDL